MAEVPGVTGFSLRSSLDDPADGFTVETSDLTLAVAEPDEDLRLTLSAGLKALAVEDQPEILVQQIEAGVLLEPRFETRRAGSTATLQGLDAIGILMRTQRAIRYVPAPAPQVLAEAEDEEDTGVETKAGHWTARDVAADLVAGTGLQLLFLARSYRLRLPFDGIGNVHALLRRLVEPWDQPQPLGVDIYARGGIVIVRERELAPAATLSRTLATSRFDFVSRGRTRARLIGRLELGGMLASSRLTEADDGEGGVIFLGGDGGGPEPSREPLTQTVVRETGGTSLGLPVIQSRTTQVLTYRMPDKLLIRSVETRQERQPDGIMVITKVETQDHTFDASVYGPRGAINQPLPRKSVTTANTRVPGPEGVMVLAPTGEVVISYGYDEQNFCRLQTTSTKKRFVTSGPLLETTRDTIAWITAAGGFTRINRTTETFDEQGKVSATTSEDAPWSGGLPPGGVRPPGGTFSGFGLGAVPSAEMDAATLKPITLVTTLSDDPTAERVLYRNENLDADDLAYLRDRYAAASGCYAYTVGFSGPAMLRLAKAEVLDLTGVIPHGLVEPVAMGPALVRALTLRYEPATASLRAQGEAVFYG